MTNTAEEIVSREVVYGVYFRFEYWTVKLSNGTLTNRRVICLPYDRVAILPVTSEGKMILVKQYRASLEEEIWEIPGGKDEGNQTNKSGDRGRRRN